MSWSETLQNVGSELLNEFWRPLRSRSSSPPEILYHYTNAAGLRGILTEKSVWATHASFMNDPKEILHGHRLFRQALSDARRSSDGLRREFMETCTRNLELCLNEEESLAAAYFASFSAKADDLSQYRAYSAGGAGYCIGFSAEALLKGAQKESYAGAGHVFELVQINYCGSKQAELMQNLLEASWDKADSIARLPNANKKHVFHLVSIDCMRTAVTLASYFKQEGYKDEEEWRIVPTPFAAPMALNLERYHRVRQRGELFVPYLEIDISDDNGRLSCLREIWTGPKLPFELAHGGILMLLSEARTEADDLMVEVKRSSTSLQ